jgi:hypothetical protein
LTPVNVSHSVDPLFEKPTGVKTNLYLIHLIKCRTEQLEQTESERFVNRESSTNTEPQGN